MDLAEVMVWDCRDGMVQILIKAPIKKVMDVYSNMEVWKNWNPYVTSRFIEQVDQSSKVCGCFSMY